MTGAPPFHTRRPFTRREAQAAGLDVSTVRTGSYRQLFAGTWVDATVPDSADLRRAAALLRSGDDAFLRGRSAARVHGGVVPDSETIEVGVIGRRGPRVDGLSPRTYPPPGPTVARVRGHRTLPAAHLLADLGADLPLVDLVALGDSLVRPDRLTPEMLEGRTRELSTHRRAHQAAGLVRLGVMSPMETRARLLLVLAGLPEPVVDHQLVGEDGQLRYRIDLAYPARRVAVEFDGRHHIERQEQWTRDLARREDIESDGWCFVVLTAADVYGRAGRTIQRVRAALASRGPDVPTSDGWRPHFEMR